MCRLESISSCAATTSSSANVRSTTGRTAPLSTSGQTAMAVSATISASEADFERYSSHHRHSTLAWARRNPKHPNTVATLAKSRADWMAYLGWTRPHYGWTIFVARKADQ